MTRRVKEVLVIAVFLLIATIVVASISGIDSVANCEDFIVCEQSR